MEARAVGWWLGPRARRLTQVFGNRVEDAGLDGAPEGEEAVERHVEDDGGPHEALGEVAKEEDPTEGHATGPENTDAEYENERRFDIRHAILERGNRLA